jgi:hypothetical protein
MRCNLLSASAAALLLGLLFIRTIGAAAKPKTKIEGHSCRSGLLHIVLLGNDNAAHRIYIEYVFACLLLAYWSGRRVLPGAALRYTILTGVKTLCGLAQRFFFWQGLQKSDTQEGP